MEIDDKPKIIKMDKKNIRLAGFALGASMILAVPFTNVVGYYRAKDRLVEYRSVEKATQAHQDKCVVTGAPWDQIYNVYFGTGERIAFRQFEKNYE